MQISKGVPKRIVAIIWTTVSSFFLWLLSFGIKQEFTFQSFFIVASIAFGWSAAYHFLTNILVSPYTDSNKKEWYKMLGVMFSMLFCLVFAGLCVAIDVRIWPKNGLLSLFGIFAFYIVGYFFSMKAEKIFKTLVT